MTQLQQKLTLPAAMAEKLEVVRRRTLKVRIGTSIVAAAGVLLAAMAVAMLVDWLATLYDFRWRATLTYTAWTAGGATLLTWAVAAWRHTRRVDHMAAKVDREIPELEERWSTVTDLSINGKSKQVHPAMFKQVSSEAQSWSPRVEADRVVPLDGLIRALLFLTAITSILGLAVVFDSPRVTVLLKRFWQPYTAISATELIDISDQKVVGRGESFEIAANLVGSPVEQAALLLEPRSGEPKTITLIPRGESKNLLTHRLRSVKEPMRYRLRAGDGQTPWYEIVVADRPQLANVRLKLTPPAYTRKDPKVVNKLPRRITVLEGSQVEIALKPKQALQSLHLKLGAGLTEQLTADEQDWYRWQTTITESFSFQPLLTEEHGLGNLRPPTCEIKCRPDKPPVVKILTPNSQIAVRPDESIPVTFVASDDVGVHQAELLVYDENQTEDGKPRVLDRIPVPLGDQQGAVKVKATVQLDLSKYETTDGSELSFSIRVREDRGQQLLANRPASPSPVTSQETQVVQAVEASPQDASPAEANSATDNQTPQLANAAPADAELADSPAPSNTATQDNTIAKADSESSAAPMAAQPPSFAAESSDLDQDSSVELASASSPAEAQNSEAQNSASTGENPPAQPAAGNTSRGGQNPPQVETTDAPTPASETSPTMQPEDPAAADPSNPASANAASSAAPSDQAGTPAEPTEKSDEGRTTSTGRQSLNTGESSQPQAPSDAKAEAGETSPAESTAPNSDQPSNSANGPNSAASNNPPNSNQAQQSGQPTGQSNQAMNQNPTAQNPTAQNSNAQNSGNSANSKPSNPQGSSQAPDNPLSKRGLDVPQAQSSSSQRMKLKIDEWAGSYDGQQRQKLEIAIAPKLAALDLALEKAQTLSRAVLDDVDASKPWASKHERDVQRADEQVEAAIKVVEALEDETYDTPYAFIGLQLVDISQAHIGPARRDFWKSLQTDGAARVDSIRDGWQHTTRARELLVLLTERFQRTKIEYKMAESVEKIKKMYRIFVEDSMALLKPPGEGDRYRRKTVEFDLDDEYLKRLQEVMNMRSEMRAELARILADDPRLLRRFLDAQRNRQVVLRNELDRLMERQSELNRESRAWAVAEEDRRLQLAAILLGRHIESAQDLAIAAADLHDRFETWSPLGKEVEDAEFKATAEVLQEIATATRELSADGLRFVDESTRARKVVENAESTEIETEPAEQPFDAAQAAEQISLDAQQLYDRFSQLEVLLRKIGNRQSRADIGNFAINRLLETRRLIEQTSAWVRQLKQQQAGNYHRSAEVAQYRLAMETDSMAGKLADLEQRMANLLQSADGKLPKSIAEKARALLAALDEQAAPNQLAAVYALRRNQMPRATSRQQSALEALELAGKLYDEMVEESIKELDKLPVQDPIASLLDDPTLDELLRQLEAEVSIEEALGIPSRPSNLRIMSDWLRSGGDNALMTGGNNRMMMNQMRQQQQMRQRQLDQAYRRAVARALKEAQADDLVKGMPKLARETADWNRLASELSDDLRQGQDKAPPERYRRAIEQYYRQISGSEKDSE